MNKAKPFSVNQKFRVCVGDSVSFFSTKKQILTGVGDHANFNDSVRYILEQYESCNITDKRVLWFAGRCHDCNIQLDLR